MTRALALLICGLFVSGCGDRAGDAARDPDVETRLAALETRLARQEKAHAEERALMIQALEASTDRLDAVLAALLSGRTDPKPIGSGDGDPKSTDPKSTDPKRAAPGALPATGPSTTAPSTTTPSTTNPSTTNPSTTTPPTSNPPTTNPPTTNPPTRPDPAATVPTDTNETAPRSALKVAGGSGAADGTDGDANSTTDPARGGGVDGSQMLVIFLAVALLMLVVVVVFFPGRLRGSVPEVEYSAIEEEAIAGLQADAESADEHEGEAFVSDPVAPRPSAYLPADRDFRDAGRADAALGVRGSGEAANAEGAAEWTGVWTAETIRETTRESTGETSGEAAGEDAAQSTGEVHAGEAGGVLGSPLGQVPRSRAEDRPVMHEISLDVAGQEEVAALAELLDRFLSTEPYILNEPAPQVALDDEGLHLRFFALPSLSETEHALLDDAVRRLAPRSDTRRSAG